MEELKACRFCLTSEDDDKSDLKHLFQEKLGSIQVWSLSCAGIELCEGTEVAPYICRVCLQLMEAFHQFKQTCKKADTALKMYFMTKSLPKAFLLPLDKLADIVPVKEPVLLEKKTEEVSCQTDDTVKKSNKSIQACRSPEKEEKPSKGRSGKKNTKEDEGKSIEPETKRRRSERKIASPARKKPTPSLNQPKISSVLPKRQSPKKSEETISHPTVVESRKLPKRKSAAENEYIVYRTEVIHPNESSTITLEEITEPPVQVSLEKAQAVPAKPKILNNTIKKPRQLDETHLMKQVIIDGNDHGVLIELNQGDNNLAFSCDFCPRSFPLRQQLDLHLQTHDREKKFTCSICDNRFLNKHNLTKHMLVHMDKMFACKFCSKSFSRNNILKSHQEREHAEQLIFCDECEKGFVERDELNAHRQEAHVRVRRFQCKFCDKQFAYKQGLERHEVVHNPNQQHTCEHCGQGFNTANKLSRHLLATHAGDRRYPCKYCPKTFIMSHHRSRHMKGHINGTLRKSKKSDEVSYTLKMEIDEEEEPKEENHEDETDESYFVVTEVEEAEPDYEVMQSDELDERFIENEVDNIEIEEICIKEESSTVLTALAKIPQSVTVKKNRKT